MTRTGIFVVLLFIFGSACKKDKPEIVSEDNSWHAVNDIKGQDKIQINSIVNNGRLLVQSVSYIIVVDSLNRAISNIVTGATTYASVPIHPVFHIVTQKQSYLSFISNVDFSVTNLWVKDVDTSLTEFLVDSRFFTAEIAINNNGTMLLCGKHTDGSYSHYLVKYDLTDYGALTKKPAFIKRINIAPYKTHPFGVYAVDNDFYLFKTPVSADDFNPSTLQIDENGNFKKLNGLGGQRVFRYKDEIYLFESNSIYSSIDNGNTWNLKYSSSINIGFYIPVVLQDKIYIYNDHELAVFEPTSSGANIKKLDLKGLESNYITSLSTFNNRLYITTLSGLYYKDLDKLE